MSKEKNIIIIICVFIIAIVLVIINFSFDKSIEETRGNNPKYDTVSVVETEKKSDNIKRSDSDEIVSVNGESNEETLDVSTLFSGTDGEDETQTRNDNNKVDKPLEKDTQGTGWGHLY